MAPPWRWLTILASVTLVWLMLSPHAVRTAAPTLAAADDWIVATPESQRMSRAGLDALRDGLAARQTRALLVVRRDRIVYEWYAAGQSASDRQGTASLAKAIVGGLSLAIALSDQRIALDEAVATYVPQWRGDARRSRITIRQLGSHTSGLSDAESQQTPHDQLTGWKGDFWKRLDPPRDPFTLSRDAAPVEIEPGTAMRYSNPGIAMLTYAVTAAMAKSTSANPASANPTSARPASANPTSKNPTSATPASTKQASANQASADLTARNGSPQQRQDSAPRDIRTLLRERIMQPIGVTDDEWSIGYGRTFLVSDLPLVASWGGAAYTPRAAAKVGRLLLHGGMWDGRRLLSAEAIRLVTSDAGTPGHGAMGWWSNAEGVDPHLPRDAYWGSGAGHQTLLVIPSLDLVVIRNGERLGESPFDPAGFHQPVSRYLSGPLMDVVLDRAAHD